MQSLLGGGGGGEGVGGEGSHWRMMGIVLYSSTLSDLDLN